MKLGYKRIILDYHFSDFLPQTLAAVDPVDYVRRMKDAGVESFLVYAKDHWGHVYHHTKISHKQRNAPDDLFGTLLDLCRKNGIIPFAYTCVMWDEFTARNHPEWRSRDAQGLLMEMAPPAGAGWHFVCYNSPYQDFFMAQLDELAANYDFPALFVDIMGYNAASCTCYCDSCRAKWKAQFGSEMPAPLKSVQDRIRYAAFRDASLRAFYERMNAVLARNGKGDILVTHNFGGDPSLPTYLGKETEPFGQDYVVPQVIIKETRNRAAGRETEIYFGRFNRFWDFTVKSKEMLRWETVNCLAHDTAAIIIDQPLLDGKLDPQSYKAIGFAYHQADKLLDFTRDSKSYAEIGVYYDALNYEATAFEGHDDFLGACKLLTECHWPWDLVTGFDDVSVLENQDTAEGGCATKNRFAAVVLPHTPLVPAKMQAALRKYVQNGGTVICDYSAGVWDEKGAPSAGRHFLVDVGDHTPRSVNFIRPVLCGPAAPGWEGQQQDTAEGGCATGVDATYLRTSQMLEIAPQAGDEVLGVQVPGALERNQWAWVSHNTPPDTADGGPAVIVRKLGKGRVLYFNTRIFSEYLNTNLGSLRQFIRLCIERVYQPRVWVQAPSIVDAIYQQKDGQVIVTLNVCTLDRGANVSSMFYGTLPPLHANINESWPVSGMKLWSRGPVAQATMLDGTKCAIARQGALICVDLPAIEGFGAVRLKLS